MFSRLIRTSALVALAYILLLQAGLIPAVRAMAAASPFGILCAPGDAPATPAQHADCALACLLPAAGTGGEPDPLARATAPYRNFAVLHYGPVPRAGVRATSLPHDARPRAPPAA